VFPSALTLKDVFLKTRHYFGFLAPALSWIIVFALGNPTEAATLATSFATLFHGPVIAGLVLLVVSYVVGATLTPLSFRILGTLLGWLDVMTALAATSRLGALVHFLDARLHLVSSRTLRNEYKHFDATAVNLPHLARYTTTTDPAALWWLHKHYVLARSIPLGREILEAEDEINLNGGMCGPIATAGILLLAHGHNFGGALMGAAIYLALQFQYVQHYQIGLVEEMPRVLAAILADEHDGRTSLIDE
jgi:hypothetical protein